jgi:hypothetical protein
LKRVEIMTLTDHTEADEAGSLQQALDNLRYQLRRGETAGVIAMYELAALANGATEEQIRETRQ